jgi:hypothetical protein
MSEPASAVLQAPAPSWEEAVHSGRCPVCLLLGQNEFEELRWWVGGEAAAPQDRRPLHEAGGFCNSHFWLLSELHSPQTGSLLNDRIASGLLQSLRASAEQGWQSQAAWLQRAAARCPVCARLRACESAHVQRFVEWVSDSGTWPEYAESRGLCLPHLVRCQALIRDPSLQERLNQAQVEQIERLQREMGALVRKLATGRRWDATRDEWAAYKRAAEKFVGRSGLLPP